MVVLAASISTKSGRSLLSRQFVEMSRTRIEGILASFPKLIGLTGGSSVGANGAVASGHQHTYVETENVRYLYQPIETLFLVLVTTKASNIVQDLDTLRLMSKIIPEYTQSVTEASVLENAFEIIFAFDEVISLGYRETNINLQTIRTNLEMDSHEEKLHIMIKQSKEKEAEENMRRRAAEIKKQQQLAAKSGVPSMTGFGNTPSATGFGPNTTLSGGSFATSNSSTGFGSSFSPAPSPSLSTSTSASASASNAAGAPKKGMQLGKKKKGNDFIEAMAAEDGIDASADVSTTRVAAAAAAAPGAIAPRIEGIQVQVHENIQVELSSDGSLNSMQVNGQVQVLCTDSERKLSLVIDKNDKINGDKFQFSINPKVKWIDPNTLGLKDAGRALPAGTAVGMLRWRMKPTQDVGAIPINLNVWPEVAGNGTMNVNISYDLQDKSISVYDATIIIPLSSAEEPSIVSIEGGEQRWESKRQLLIWSINEISEERNPSGTLEFNIKAKSDAGFYPVELKYSSNNILCKIDVLKVLDADANNDPVKFACDKKTIVDKYEVVRSE